MFLDIVICEDDLLQREYLAHCLSQILKDKEVDYRIIEFSSGEELLDNYPDKIDILFLDIQMNKISGMDTARKIREFDNNVEIVFTTAILDYIHEGYEVRAYRYLLKPIDYESILKHTYACIDELINKKDTIAIKDKSQTAIIQINNILYVEVLRKEITVYTEEDKYLFKKSMKSVENKLLKKDFFRCHKSYLINLKKVKSFKNDMVIINSCEIPISRYKLKGLKTRLADIWGDMLC